MEICTIGFTKRTAEDFFETLRAAGIRRVMDVRLRADSQLAGFTRARDMPYLCERLLSAEYVIEPSLAPTAEMLDAYRHGAVSWEEYEGLYLALLADRQVTDRLPSGLFDVPTVLLCSERTEERCHRRIAAEVLTRTVPGARVNHL